MQGIKLLAEEAGHLLFEVTGVTNNYVSEGFKNSYRDPYEYQFARGHFDNPKSDFPMQDEPQNTPIELAPNESLKAKTHLPIQVGRYFRSIEGYIRKRRTTLQVTRLQWELGNVETKYVSELLDLPNGPHEGKFCASKEFTLDKDDILWPFFSEANRDPYIPTFNRGQKSAKI